MTSDLHEPDDMTPNEALAADAHQRLSGECCKNCQYFDSALFLGGTCLRDDWNYCTRAPSEWCEHWVERQAARIANDAR